MLCHDGRTLELYSLTAITHAFHKHIYENDTSFGCCIPPHTLPCAILIKRLN